MEVEHEARVVQRDTIISRQKSVSFFFFFLFFFLSISLDFVVFHNYMSEGVDRKKYLRQTETLRH